MLNRNPESVFIIDESFTDFSQTSPCTTRKFYFSRSRRLCFFKKLILFCFFKIDDVSKVILSPSL